MDKTLKQMIVDDDIKDLIGVAHSLGQADEDKKMADYRVLTHELEVRGLQYVSLHEGAEILGIINGANPINLPELLCRENVDNPRCTKQIIMVRLAERVPAEAIYIGSARCHSQILHVFLADKEYPPSGYAPGNDPDEIEL